jgi:TrmH family RNA methyltransferase
MLSKSEAKYIQSLADRKSRAEHGVFIAEGPKIIAGLLTGNKEKIVCLYAVKAWIEQHGISAAGVEIREVEDYELDKISTLVSPQQVLATVKIPYRDFIPFAANEWLLMLDGIQDPGNMGSIIRIADWFGITAIYCTPDTVDCFNPKVVQAAMGSLLQVHMVYGNCRQWLAETTVPIYPTLLEGENIFTIGKLTPGIIIIGNEGRGISQALLSNYSRALTIPKKGNAESLNAAVATGIVVAGLLGV